MEIKEIAIKDSTVYGLGTDNKMYRWDYGVAAWIPFWNRHPEEAVPPAKAPSTGAPIPPPAA
jgi:hypothetical protein